MLKYCGEQKMEVAKMAQVLAHYARHRASDSKFASPFAYAAFQVGAGKCAEKVRESLRREEKRGAFEMKRLPCCQMPRVVWSARCAPALHLLRSSCSPRPASLPQAGYAYMGGKMDDITGAGMWGPGVGGAGVWGRRASRVGLGAHTRERQRVAAQPRCGRWAVW